MMRRTWGGTLLALAVLAGCDGGEPADTAVTGGEAGCVSDLEYFQKEVSLAFLEQDCATCHNPQGLAKASKVVLASPGETGYLQANFDTLKDIAAYERDGVSVLLLKPSAAVDHGGGKRFATDDPRYRALEELVARFKDPVTCDGGPGPEAGLMGKVKLIDLPATLRKVKLQLVGALPDTDELEAVAAGGEAALDARIAAYLEEDAFYDVLRRWYNDTFLTDKYARGDEATNLLDGDAYPDRHYYNHLPDDTEEGQLARRYGNLSVAREPLDLIAYVVRKNRPFTEILTADYTLLNPFSARVYGASVQFDNPLDPNEFREVKLPGVPHAGVLTSPMFLNRYPTTPTNRNRHRSRMVYKFFLATDILEKAERPVDPTTIRDHNPTMNNPQCTICHAAVDPIAGAFQNWTDRGRFEPPEEGWFADMRPPGFGEVDIPPDDWGHSLQWLASQLVRDERFALSAVQAVYEGLVGRPVVKNPTDQSDPRFEARLAFYNQEQAFLRSTTDAFIEGGYNLKVIVPLVVKSAFYRAEDVDGADEAELVSLEPLGTMRLLTPEELDMRLIATVGRPWQRRVTERNFLLSSQEFRFFYGGIDSDNITTRISEPNGIMANIQLRMANEMACYTVANDLRLAPDERFLFPHVETTYTPEDDNGFPVPQAEEAIRRNIRYLHHRLLGEVLVPGDAQEEATFELFLQTWREGYQAVANGQINRDLPSHCQGRYDFWTNEDLPDPERLVRDDRYTVRAWMAVMTYLLADWRFLYHQ
ncbi:MAG: hypothetical protein R3F60_12585 [bacterium]